MKITVRYFASIREAIGHGSESVDTTAATRARCAMNSSPAAAPTPAAWPAAVRCAWR